MLERKGVELRRGGEKRGRGGPPISPLSQHGLCSLIRRVLSASPSPECLGNLILEGPSDAPPAHAEESYPPLSLPLSLSWFLCSFRESHSSEKPPQVSLSAPRLSLASLARVRVRSRAVCVRARVGGAPIAA